MIMDSIEFLNHVIVGLVSRKTAMDIKQVQIKGSISSKYLK